ncbi:MAG: chalcone isomerase family protein [Pseudoalteromonas sp.]|uniref:chalcone isomerase family protein n=1 Tax=unclassified Pseudoalteromonas TaxID=194690 RepID=UPI003F947BB5
MKYVITSCLVALALLCSSNSFAADFKAVGEARLEYLFWDVYDAKLATPTGQYKFGDHPAKLTLTYLRDFTAKDIIKATNEQWLHLGKDTIVGKYDSQLKQFWPDIKKGQSLAFITDDSGKGTFYFNDEKLGQVDGEGFADDFLAIWLSSGTSEPTMRKQLIGQ